MKRKCRRHQLSSMESVQKLGTALWCGGSLGSVCVLEFHTTVAGLRSISASNFTICCISFACNIRNKTLHVEILSWRHAAKPHLSFPSNLMLVTVSWVLKSVVHRPASALPGILWEMQRSGTPPPPYWPRVCILVRSQGVLCMLKSGKEWSTQYQENNWKRSYLSL